jgi:hypothetical protein
MFNLLPSPRAIAGLLTLALGPAATGFLLLSGPTATTPGAAGRQMAPRCAERVHARMFFGLTGPAGSVSEAEWDAFLMEVVTPRFPGGLTVLHASGHWRRAGEPLQREASRVVEIVHDDSRHARCLIDQIAALYKARFLQESVLIVRTPADVCF